MPDSKPVTILLAEDDDDDFLLTQKALRRSRVANDLRRVHDGEELLHYLRNERQYRDQDEFPAPTLVLLDLNMPRMDGREALRVMRADAALRHLPVVILTTSGAEEDVVRTYQLGVNSFIQKPITFEGLVEALDVMGQYWFQIVALPGGGAQ